MNTFLKIQAMIIGALLTMILVFATGLLFTRGDQIIRILDNIEAVSDRAAKITANANTTLARIDRVAALQEAQLTSERSQKAVQASLEAAATAKATFQLINVTTIPQLNRTLAALQDSADGLSGTAGSAIATIDSLGRLAEGVRPQVDALLDESGATLAKIGMVADQVRADEKALAREAIGTLAQTREITQQLTIISANLADASAQAPGIARNLENITRKGPIWSRAFGAARVAAAIFGAIW